MNPALQIINKTVENNRKSNKQFMILSAIMIIIVVDSHSWVRINIANSIIPYNSFFMPMFMFISGYFYNADKNKAHPIKFIKGKLLHLVYPYYKWSLFYALLILILWYSTPIRITQVTLLKYFLGPWISGEQFSINNPSWFLPTLFLVSCVYLFIRLVLNGIYKTKWGEHIFVGVLVIVGAIAVYQARLGVIEHYPLMLQPLRVLFMLQFFAIGQLYRRHLEQVIKKKLKRHYRMIICTVAVIANACIQHYVGSINYTVNRMSFNYKIDIHSMAVCFIPALTAIIGIAFWLIITDIITPILEKNLIVNYISIHTFDIMMNQILFMAVLNWLLVLLNRLSPINSLDITKALCDPWYRYQDSGGIFYTFYFLAGLGGSIMLSVLIDGLRMKKESDENRNSMNKRVFDVLKY